MSSDYEILWYYDYHHTFDYTKHYLMCIHIQIYLISYNQNSITLPTRKTASLWTSTPGHPHKTPLTPPSQHPTNQVINWPLDNSFTFIRRIASLTAVKTKAHGPEHMAFADYANEPHPANCSQERVVTPDACVFFTYFF